MQDTTTIQVTRELLAVLARMKKHPRQSYNEVIGELASKSGKADPQYDAYLHNIQKGKMKELWDNEADSEWDRA